jgi:hypothetical protein
LDMRLSPHSTYLDTGWARATGRPPAGERHDPSDAPQSRHANALPPTQQRNVDLEPNQVGREGWKVVRISPPTIGSLVWRVGAVKRPGSECCDQKRLEVSTPRRREVAQATIASDRNVEPEPDCPVCLQVIASPRNHPTLFVPSEIEVSSASGNWASTS